MLDVLWRYRTKDKSGGVALFLSGHVTYFTLRVYDIPGRPRGAYDGLGPIFKNEKPSTDTLPAKRSKMYRVEVYPLAVSEFSDAKVV